VGRKCGQNNSPRSKMIASWQLVTELRTKEKGKAKSERSTKGKNGKRDAAQGGMARWLRAVRDQTSGENTRVAAWGDGPDFLAEGLRAQTKKGGNVDARKRGLIEKTPAEG